MGKILAVLSLAAAFLFLACDGEGGRQTATLQDITDAVSSYVGATGLDSDTFSLTDPLTCDAIADQVNAAGTEDEAGQIIAETVGKVCFLSDQPQVNGDTATISIGIYATEASWELTLTGQDGDWQVTDVNFTGQ
ncbi:MAG: hypothetical protein HYS09_08745 [Chloroflexi bacterium]|nr:hypothetical protein [Chloroflexota bacterium]